MKKTSSKARKTATPLSSSYFAKSSEQSVPIRPLALRDFAAWQAKAAPLERALAGAQNFTARETELLMVPNQDRGISHVMLGLGHTRQVEKLLSLAANKLPEGCYRLEDQLSEHESDKAALFWALGQYNFSRYRKIQPRGARRLQWLPNANVRRITALTKAVFFARDLINTPTNDMGPDDLAKAAAALAHEFKARLTVTTGDMLLKKRLPAIHAVGRAALKAPRLIDLVWGNRKHPKVTLVGKGVCFDSGGLNIKSEQSMRMMKKDMGGGAVALGLARAIMETKLPVRLRVLVPAVENAISGNAYRPGDILNTRAGLTVEVGNTDAEGRIVLCDALALADEERPALLMDFATLTGAARTALGPDVGVFYTTHDSLADNLLNAGLEMGDPLWRLPLWKPYREWLKSPVADLCNISTAAYAGSITAALYLMEFVSKAQAWAHFDVYCWNPSDAPAKPRGAEASGLLASYAYLEQRFGRGT